MQHKPYGVYEKFLKRPFDFILSFFGLLILSPVFLILAILVRIKLGSPVIFTQKRPGRMDKISGEPKIFSLCKFRTMTNACDSDGVLLPDSERLTKFGRFLRSTSLDELPELFNILKGDMAIVGPRPLLVRYLGRYDKTQARRHEVRPGFTGLAQVNGRNALSWEEKFAYDVKYVDKVTFTGDFRITLQTIGTVLKREGISAEGEATMSEFTGSGEVKAEKELL